MTRDDDMALPVGDGLSSQATAPEVAAVPASIPSADTLYCNFCGKSQHDVLVLVAGPIAFICEACTDMCASIIAEARTRKIIREEVGKLAQAMAARSGETSGSTEGNSAVPQECAGGEP